MAIAQADRQNIALHFHGQWKARDHLTVWDRAYAAYQRRYPSSTMTAAEFEQTCQMRGIQAQAVGGGGDRPHDVRLSVGIG